jgi:Na+/H+ antiporter NhaC
MRLSRMFLLLIIASLVVLPLALQGYSAQEGETATTADAPIYYGWLSLVPPLLAIGLALLTRDVLVSLFLGIFGGALILNSWNPLIAFTQTIDHFIVSQIADEDHAAILLFTVLLGGMVGLITKSGGTHGIVERLAPYATNSRRGQLATWAMGLVIFFDDYANTLIVGPTMRPITDKLRISREKLAYIVDSTAAPVASIALISTWIGYEVSLIGVSLKDIGSTLDPYTIFLQSLPYNFYPLLSLVLGFVVAVSVRDFGPMLQAERRAATGKLLSDTAIPLADFDSTDLAPPDGKPRRWFNAVIPILVVLTVTFIGLWITGRASMEASGYERGSASLIKFIGDLFGAADSYKALLWASAAGSVVALGLAVSQRIITLNEGMSAWVNGVKSMIMAILILVLAWSIADVCNALNTQGFIVEALSDNVDPRMLPALVFVLAALTAFATGSSWARGEDRTTTLPSTRISR